MRLLFAVGVASTVAATATTAAMAVTPRPLLSGTYSAMFVNTFQAGSGCVGQIGAAPGVMLFGGVDDPRFSLRLPLGGGLLSTHIFTVTGGRGTKHLSGTFGWRGRGPVTWDVHGTFSADFSGLDRYSFVARLAEKYGSCTEDDNITSVRMGPKE